MVDNVNTSVLNAEILYSAAAGMFTASTVLRNDIAHSSDYSLSLMLNPFASHTFVYYAASVDFVGEYIQMLHFNDKSVFKVIALASNTKVRIASNCDAIIRGRLIHYEEEYRESQ